MDETLQLKLFGYDMHAGCSGVWRFAVSVLHSAAIELFTKKMSVREITRWGA